MNDVKSVLFVGVGGQGTILASKILCSGLIQAGYDVKMSEVHGMAQRGGSVTTQVRYGKKIDSPIIGKGSADVIVSFEKIEALRWIDYLKPNGRLVVNNHKIDSATVISGLEKYPENILEKLEKNIKKLTILDADKEAKNIGNSKVQNVILLGSLIKALEIEKLDWEKIIKENVKENFVEINLKALECGMNFVK